MMLYIRIVIYCLLGIGAYFLHSKGFVVYGYGDFKDFVGALIAISGMIFTIMGIWIAFLYPNALARIVSSNVKSADFSDGGEDARRLEKIVAAVLLSALVAVASAFCFFWKMLLGGAAFYVGNVLEIKSLALAFITILSLVQLEAVWSVVVANVLFLTDLHQKREKRAQDDSY